MRAASPSDKIKDHGGGLDAAARSFGGSRADWMDLSTGINPLPYNVGAIPPNAWTALPDATAQDALIAAARAFWNVPDGAAILAAPGASCLIANMPRLATTGTVSIAGPTYNEHAAAFDVADWHVNGDAPTATVVVNPNNPDGRIWQPKELTTPLRIIDESFCDVTPDATHMADATAKGTVILKSFGKFWGLAGLRLGFAIGDPELIGALKEMLGPWPVSGPALHVGAAALNDHAWATETRNRLTTDVAKLDTLMTAKGATLVGGTTLFRLYDVGDAAAWQTKLAQSHIWSRIFPYSDRWLRLGLPHPLDWKRLEDAL
jgi:cobalamin biosynthetic protein CobC